MQLPQIIVVVVVAVLTVVAVFAVVAAASVSITPRSSSRAGTAGPSEDAAASVYIEIILPGRHAGRHGRPLEPHRLVVALNELVLCSFRHYMLILMWGQPEIEMTDINSVRQSHAACMRV